MHKTARGTAPTSSRTRALACRIAKERSGGARSVRSSPSALTSAAKRRPPRFRTRSGPSDPNGLKDYPRVAISSIFGATARTLFWMPRRGFASRFETINPSFSSSRTSFVIAER